MERERRSTLWLRDSRRSIQWFLLVHSILTSFSLLCLNPSPLSSPSPLSFLLPPPFPFPSSPLLHSIFQSNGSLLIQNVSQDQASQYDCHLSNIFGSDNRTFFLRVVGMTDHIVVLDKCAIHMSSAHMQFSPTGLRNSVSLNLEICLWE